MKTSFFLPVATAAMILAGCGASTRTGTAPAATPVPVVTAAPPAEKPIPPPPRKPKPPARKPVPEAARPSAPSPITIIGMSRVDVTAALGEPTQRSERNPGEVWIYRATGCGVEILFLLDVVRNDLFAVDSKITGAEGAAGEQQCLQRIKTARGT